MSNINAPRGFKPARYADGRPFDGATTPYRLASGYGTAIYTGDAVSLVAGYVNKAGASAQIRGVAAGFSWRSASGTIMFSPYWPAGTLTLAAQDAQVLVYDDPNVVFEAQFTNSVSVPVVADIGKYFKLYDAGGIPASGMSGEGIDYSTATPTSTSGVWRFLEFTQRQDNDPTSAYSRGAFMPTLHDARVNSGAV